CTVSRMFFFFSSRRRHTRLVSDWSSDVCSSDLLARELGVPPRRINEIVLGKRGITADTALRLAKRFGNSARFWMGLQADFDLQQIGRASCRERGEIAVGAVSLKKKEREG